MATNRIKIEVDFNDAVAKIDQLKVGFREIGQNTVEARDRILKMVSSTKVAADGSVKALMREKAAWQQIQVSLSTTNEQYRKYQVQIDAIEKQIQKITDTRKREEIALKNSANGIRQQIEVLKQERDNRKLSNTQYQKMTDEIEKLEQKHRSLTNTVKAGTIASFDQQIEALRRQQREVATSREEIEKYEKQIERLRLRKNALTGETKSLDKAAQSFSSSAGAAGATVTEFGRTIGDLPFGLIGITNNIQQLSQQFTDLQAKQGGFKNAMQSVMKTMMGPAGFVVLINIATSALLYFTRQKQEATKKTEEFNASLLVEMKTFDRLKNIYESANTSLEDRQAIIDALITADQKYAKAIEKAGDDEGARNAITEKYLSLRQKLNGLEQTRNEIAENYGEDRSTWYRQDTAEVLTAEKRAEIQEKLNKLRETEVEGGSIAFQVKMKEIQQLEQILKDSDELVGVNMELVNAIKEVTAAERELNEVLGESEIDNFLNKLRDFEKERDKSRALRGLEGSAAIREEIKLLEEDYDKALEKFGVNSVEAQEARMEVEKKRFELEETLYEERQDRLDEEAEDQKDRNERLAEINQEYLDNLYLQNDESGILRLKQEEERAIAEAKALGASQGDLMVIAAYYANERKKIREAEAEEAAESAKKEADKLKKENDKSLKEGLDAAKERLDKFYDDQTEALKARFEVMSEILTNFSTLLGELDQISQSRFERQINSLKEQRDIIRTNDALTKEEKEQQLTDLQRRENELQRQRIDAEYKMFAITQTLTIAEMAMKERAAFRERQLMKQKFIEEQKMMQISLVMKAVNEGQISAMEASGAITSINLTAAEEMGKAGMSIGTYVQQLGPLGIAAFALSIGGVIASIVSAKRKAGAEIAGLSDAPVSLGGGGGATPAAPAAPSFNVVGASAQNQLAEAIAGTESQPVKAYVVSSDVTTAQELDRKIVEGASI